VERSGIGVADATAGSALYSGRGSPTLTRKRADPTTTIPANAVQSAASWFPSLRVAGIERRAARFVVRISAGVSLSRRCISVEVVPVEESSTQSSPEPPPEKAGGGHRRSVRG
jgi:hypothetical protein